MSLSGTKKLFMRGEAPVRGERGKAFLGYELTLLLFDVVMIIVISDDNYARRREEQGRGGRNEVSCACPHI